MTAAAAPTNTAAAPPSPHLAERAAVLTPATARRARSANSPSPHDALPLTQLSDSSPARQRDSPIAATRQQPSKPIIDPASGYVPEIDAPPSVAVCSGHRCVRGSA